MNATMIDTEVRDYLAEVREHLSDLPEDELDDLTIDLEAHLVEVHAEAGAPLAARLGSPSAYAAELRASAGFDRLRPGRPTLAARMAARSRELVAHPAAVRARDAWSSFRPVWIAIRGWLLVATWLVVSGDAMPFQIFPIPHIGSTLIGIAAVALATALSYAAAGRAGEHSRWRTADVGFTAAVAFLLLVALTSGAVLARPNGFVVQGPSEDEILANYPLAGASNIFVYDLEGNPLDAVLLYDQDGNPIDLHPWYDPAGEEVRFLEDRFGEPVKNAYPVQQFRFTPIVDEETGAEIDAAYEPVPPPRVPLPDVASRPDPAPRTEEPAAEPTRPTGR